jgi:hypothetical protein
MFLRKDPLGSMKAPKRVPLKSHSTEQWCFVKETEGFILEIECCSLFPQIPEEEKKKG